MARFSWTVGLLAVALPLASVGAPSATAVADAAMKGDVGGLRALIGQKADVNAPQADGSTALHWAAQLNSLEAADLLIKAGADPKAATRLGATPLYLACEGGNAAMIQKLLAAGADPNAPFLMHGETPLMFAARSGNVEAVKVLLDAGAKMEAKETLRDTTALLWAAEQNHPEVVKLLIARGADLKAASKIVIPPARRAPAPTTRVLDPEVDFIPPPPAAKGGVTALISAAREGYVETATVLLDGGAPINQQSADGSTALLVAVQNGQSTVARMLIERGADVDLPNAKGWNPLYIAVKNRTIETGAMPVPSGEGMLDLIKLLLDKGANVNSRLKGDTEVHNTVTATWLKEPGATPFLRASLTGDLEVMKLLLARGADPKIATNDGTTALMALCGVGYAEGFIHDYGGPDQSLAAMKILLDLGLDVNAKNKEDITALHGAAHKNFLAAIQLLVDHGADLTAQSKGNIKSKGKGLAVLDWAEGVPIGQGPSGIYHAEAVELVETLMKAQNIPLPVASARTKGGNAITKIEITKAEK